MPDPQLAAVVAELDRRRRRARFDSGGALSPHQLLAWNDQARDQAWPCGRRAGKTDLAQKLLLRTALGQARVQAVYVSTTIKRALATVWDELVDLNEEFCLGGVVNVQKSTFTFPNRSRVVITGCENKAMANDIRGRRRVALYIVDECQDWKDDLLKYFVEQVVHWSKADVRGSCVLAGTGGAPRGFWAAACLAASEWSKHSWTAFDNPYLAPGEARALIDKACKDRKVTEDDPSIQREFYARFVVDLLRQIFQYDQAKNGFGAGMFHQLPTQGEASTVVAGDVGTVDKTAVGALRWWESDPRLWLAKSIAKSGLGATDQAALIQSFLDEFADTLRGAVVDPGGGGKALIVDFKAGPNGVQVEAAEKEGKVSACLLLRDALRRGEVMIDASDAELIEDLQSVEWDPENIGAVIRGHMPDPIDMLLYGFRKARALNWYRPTPPPKPKPAEAEAMATRWEEFDEKAERGEDDVDRW